jgi:hypothetical protein
VGGLVQRVEREPPLSDRDRHVPALLGDVRFDEAPQRARQLPAQGCGLCELPVLELRCVAQRETAEEVAAVQRDGLDQGLGAQRAHPVRFVSMGVARGDQLPEAVDIEVDRRRRQLQHRTVGDDRRGAALGEGVVERGERAAQRRPSVGLVPLRPQQRGQLVAPVAPLAAGQEGQQPDRLAGVDP